MAGMGFVFQNRRGGQVCVGLRPFQAEADPRQDHHLRQQRGQMLQDEAVPGAVRHSHLCPQL